MGVVVLIVVAAAAIVAMAVAALVHKLTRPPRRTYGVALASDLPVDPAEVGLRGVPLVLQLSDGTTSPGWRVEGGDPAGPVVVVTHGYGDSRYGALQWATVLAPMAAAVVVYDLRGHGESTARGFRGGLVEPRDLLGIVGQVSMGWESGGARDGGGGESGGLRPPAKWEGEGGAAASAARVVLFGYSLGAGVSIVAGALDAAGGGRKVAGVIADGVYRHWEEPVVALMRLRRYPVWPVVPLTYAVLRWGRPEMARFDRAAWAAQLTCPLLVLHGGEDELCPPASARAIAAAAARGTYVEFAGCAHLELAGREPGRYLAAVRAFLNGLR